MELNYNRVELRGTVDDVRPAGTSPHPSHTARRSRRYHAT